MSAADARDTARPLSLWSLASVVTSGLLCPPLCAIGVLLGIAGLAELRFRPDRRGRGMAWAGIAIGLIASAAWGGAAFWWHANIRRPLLEGPRVALAAGMDGDVDGFIIAFTAAEPEEARVFLDALATRYGGFRTMRQDPSAQTADGMIDRVRPRIAYEIEFERATVPAEAVFVVRDGAQLVLRFAHLVVRDPEQGDLAYPSAVGPGDEASGGADEDP